MGTTRYGTRLSARRRDIAQIATNATSITTNTASIDSVVSPTITQASHGFAVLDAIRHNGSAWAKALADAEANVATHVVSSVPSSSTFDVVTSGQVAKASHGLSLAQQYLSSSSAGALVSSAPSLAQPILRPISASVVEVNVQRATSASAVDNESFRADQVYMNMVNKSGGTLAKGIIVRHVDGSVTGVQESTTSTSRTSIGVTLASSADDAAVQVAYGGKVQVLVVDGTNINEGGVFKAQDDGKATSGGGTHAMGYLLEDGDLSAAGADALKWASIIIGEQG